MKHLYLENGLVNPELYEKNIIIYGCGNDGKKLYFKLKDLGANISFFCDSNENLVGSNMFDVPIISGNQLKEFNDCNLALAFCRWNEVVDRIPRCFENSLFADFLYENKTDKTCILCGSDSCTADKAHFAPFIQERMFMGRQKETSLIHCRDCGLFFSEYRPNEEEMQRLYSNYRDENYQKQRQRFEPNYTKDYNDSIFNNKENIENRKRMLSDFLMPFVQFNSIENLLDYGGDEGQFIPDNFGKSNKYVYEVSGNKVKAGVKLLTDLGEINKIKWDFIMCCHLLEHVSDPVGILKNMVNNLQNGAYLYLELPYDDFILRYSDVEINEHINFYSDAAMQIIGNIFNLHIIKIVNDGVIRALYKK